MRIIGESVHDETYQTECILKDVLKGVANDS